MKIALILVGIIALVLSGYLVWFHYEKYEPLVNSNAKLAQDLSEAREDVALLTARVNDLTERNNVQKEIIDDLMKRVELKNFKDLTQLRVWLKNDDLSEVSSLKDVPSKVAFELQRRARADGYIMNVATIEATKSMEWLDFIPGEIYVVCYAATDSAIYWVDPFTDYVELAVELRK